MLYFVKYSAITDAYYSMVNWLKHTNRCRFTEEIVVNADELLALSGDF